MENKGSIHTYTIIHTASESFKEKTPYVVAVVEKGGEKFFSLIEGYSPDKEISIGMEVEITGLDGSGRPQCKFI